MVVGSADRGQALPANALADLERRAALIETSPGWISRDEPIFWSEPRSAFLAAHWSGAALVSMLEEAAGLVDLSLAERRILALRNPIDANNFATTRTLSLAYQYMLPGEIANTHRHAPHALRVILSAEGTYSIVDGIRMPMATGDIVLTPGGCWHGHGHEGARPAYWVDALDIPLTHLLEPMFFKAHPDGHMPPTGSADESPFRFTAAAIAAALDAAAVEPEGYRRIELAAPSIPTMAIAVARLPAGIRTRPRRSTASRCFVVTAGTGCTQIGDTRFHWTRGDTIAVPAWTWYEHDGGTDANLVEISDAPLMRWCNYWREEIR